MLNKKLERTLVANQRIVVVKGHPSCAPHVATRPKIALLGANEHH